MAGGVQYETISGSMSYGVSSDSSDMDIMGFCIPDKSVIFPHLTGQIEGFGTPIPRFEQFQQHHIRERHVTDLLTKHGLAANVLKFHVEQEVELRGSSGVAEFAKISNDDLATINRTLASAKEYDITIYNIVKYFQLCMENNPNMIDSLYTPDRCITALTPIGKLVRDNRDIFLHKGSWHKFKGYSYSQMAKIRNKVNSSNPKRAATIEKFGYDVKFAYHVVRLMNEVEQILMEGTLDLERSREQLKSIRRGEWTLQQLEDYAKNREKDLEALYLTSTLRYSPDEGQIKALLMKALEEHYGSLQGAVVQNDNTPALIREMDEVLRRYR